MQPDGSVTGMKETKYIALICYLLTIPVANWLISNVGSQGFPGGPHTIPVGFGYQAPSGVLAIGVALFMRDYVQELFGKQPVLVAIAIGVGLSYVVNPVVATASAVAFAISELSDFFIYSAIKKSSVAAAVIVSGIIGGVIDSLLFLQIAFGSTLFWEGQVIGKTMMALLGGVFIWARRAVSIRLSTV